MAHDTLTPEQKLCSSLRWAANEVDSIGPDSISDGLYMQAAEMIESQSRRIAELEREKAELLDCIHPQPQSETGERKCVHCNGRGDAPECCGEMVNDNGPVCCGNYNIGDCTTCSGQGVIRSIEQYIKTLPADWHQDSSLETWFPLTAQELTRLRAPLPTRNTLLPDEPRKSRAQEIMETNDPINARNTYGTKTVHGAQPDELEDLRCDTCHDLLAPGVEKRCADCVEQATETGGSQP